MASPVSGTAVFITNGPYEASIATVGATLRALSCDGRDLIVPFAEDAVRPSYRGATLVPWPNRVVDGTYEWDGTAHQLALTEPARGHALHGLGTWLDYDVAEQSDSEAVLTATIPAQDGYPFTLEISVRFSLDDEGLHTEVTARNDSTFDAPFGTGPHPYLVAGDGHVDDWSLTIPAAAVLAVTEDRLIPTGLVDVADGPFDFRRHRAIGDTFIDHAFTGFDSENGFTEVRVTAASGTGVAMRWEAACPWVQVHTADKPDAAESRLGLAVEPMTCPPDAFNSGTDVIRLAPGESTSASWSIRAI